MTAGISSGPAAGTITPAEREARWTLYARFAIEAASEDEACTVLGQALARLKPELPLRGEPVIHPRHRRHPDDIWIAELAPDATHLEHIDPDDAKTRCRWVQGHFPGNVAWQLPKNGEREAKAEWPPDIWVRRSGPDDALLHPKLRAVMISCAAQQA
jgi:hypothetical protein